MRRAALLGAGVIVGAVWIWGCGGGGGGTEGGGILGGDELAYADMHNTQGTTQAVMIRGRLIEEDEDDLQLDESEPSDHVSQEEIKNAPVELRLRPEGGGAAVDLGTTQTDSKGYLDETIDLTDLDLAPGTHTVEVVYEGEVAGSFSARLLDTDHAEPIVRSDVDLTYLLTDFMSSSALARLLFEDATEREALPAMEVVYAELRAGANGSADRSLVFLSGSPEFFKRTLEGKMQIDGVQQDGVVLKPFKDIIAANIDDLTLDEIVPELKEQIGYKLYWLLRLRTTTPATTPELLLGDDSEADVVVYNLYHRLTSGELDLDGLMAELADLGVASSWRDLIADIAPDALAALGDQPPVIGIYINATGAGNEELPVADWTVEGLVRHHEGAWPLILDLYEEGFVAAEGVERVRTRLKALGADDAELEGQAAAAVDAGFLSADTVAEF